MHKEKNVVYYFAYGSNLDVNQMHLRVKDVRFVRKAKLSGYKLVFDTYASIVKTGNKTDFVEGIIYAITTTGEKLLDMYEGVTTNVYTKKYITFSINNLPVAVLTYIKTIKFSSPFINRSYKDYLTKIQNAYAFWGLDLDNIPQVIGMHRPSLNTTKQSYYTKKADIEPKTYYSDYNANIRLNNAIYAR